MELILGGIVSLVAQALKKWTGAKEYIALAVVLGLSLLAAVVYTILVSVGYWETVYKVLITAGAFYAFVVRRFEN